jgi:hypothetical protein
MSFDLGHKNIICLTNIDVEVKFKIFKNNSLHLKKGARMLLFLIVSKREVCLG